MGLTFLNILRLRNFLGQIFFYPIRSEQAKYDDLFDWFRDTGGSVSSKIKVNIGRYGRGIYSTETIQKEEILFNIESEWLISTSYAIEAQLKILKYVIFITHFFENYYVFIFLLFP